MKLRMTLILAVIALLAACDKGKGEQKPTEQQVAPAEQAAADKGGAPAVAAEGAPAAEAKPTAGADRGAAGAQLTPPTKGGAEPKVAIVEVSDFQCPFCGRVIPTVKQILDTYKDQVSVTFVHNPLPFHKDAKPAAIAASAAERQGKFWEMHDKLFANQRNLKPAEFEKWAQEIGLNVEQFKKDVADPAIAAWVDKNQAIAHALKATGTPAFFINGKSLKGAQPFEQFKAVIDAEIAAADAAGKKGKDWIRERTKVNNADLISYVYDGKAPPPVQARKPPQQPVDRTVYKVELDDKDTVKGNAKGALVTLVEFSDFQCPFCSRLNPAIKQVMDTYGDKVRVIFKNNPLPFHKQAFGAAEAAMCAHEQGKFWEMHDKLFANQRALERPDLDKYAGEIGLDAAAFKSCMDTHKTKARIDADQEMAGKVTARGTPNTFINGRKLTGAKPFEEFKTVIDEELKKAEALVEKGIAPENVYAEIIKNGKVYEPLDENVVEFNHDTAAVKGNKDGQIKIVEFSDFQCPFCSRVGPPLKEVAEHYGDKAGIFFKNFPLSFHKQAEHAAKAGVCAQAQGKFWEMHDLMFASQKELADDKYAEFAKKIGLDMAKFTACIDDPATKARLDADMAEGRKAGVRGTPTIYINGRKFTSPTGYNLRAFTTVIDKYVLK